MKIITQYFPGGEIRVRMRPYSSRQKKESRFSQGVDRSDSVGSCLVSKREFQERPDKGVLEGGGKNSKLRPGWGLPVNPTKFGLNARRRIKRVGGLMDSFGGEQLCITLTLPGTGHKAYKELSNWSGWVANRVKTWIFDQYVGNEEPSWFYVWEHQRRGALHMHFALHCPESVVSKRIRKGMLDEWMSILDGIESKTGVSMYTGAHGENWRLQPCKIRVSVQTTRKSLVSYFAKYCSKDYSKDGQGVFQQYLPSRWWGCSRNLLEKLREQIDGAVTGEAPMEECLDIVGPIAKVLEEQSNFVAVAMNRWQGSVELIAYGVPSVMKGLHDSIKSVLDVFGKSLTGIVDMNRDYRRARRFFRGMWRKNATRLRLVELIGTNSSEWETLVRWILEEGAVPRGQIVQLYQSMAEIEAVHDAEKDRDCSFRIQLPLDFGDG